MQEKEDVTAAAMAGLFSPVKVSGTDLLEKEIYAIDTSAADILL